MHLIFSKDCISCRLNTTPSSKWQRWLISFFKIFITVKFGYFYLLAMISMVQDTAVKIKASWKIPKLYPSVHKTPQSQYCL